MNSGWIKVHSKLLKWEWYDKSEMVQLFLYLLLSASYEPKNWHGITIERGQVIVGRSEVCAKLNLSPQVYRTCIERLKSTNEITTKTTNKFTVVTICKYDDYQQVDFGSSQQNNHQTNQQSTNNQPTNNQQITTSKEVKNKRNKEYIKDIGDVAVPAPPEIENRSVETIPPHGTKARGAARFVPPTLDEVTAYCAERGSVVDSQQWLDYYTANGWRVGKNPMKDWRAAVRTWEKSGYSKSPASIGRVSHPAANYDNNKTFEKF